MQKGQTKHTFVESSENDLGIGKVRDINGELATVEYFRSPTDKTPLKQQVSRRSLSRKVLYPETRAYFRNPESDSIEIGRILDYQRSDDLYLVRFPNNVVRMLSTDQLEVRCRLPITEPTDHLGSQVNETAFWHSSRSKFVQHLQDQHRMSGGLTALLSSSVEIVAHQVSVIRRVLMDPFQRYLLADEVGLGKTIEAGVLIKQFQLDEPSDHQTIIIVPRVLIAQWKQELTHRFHLGPFIGESIHVVSSEDHDQIDAKIPSSRMIVIDEAHHLSSWAWSSDFTQKRIFDTVAASTSNLHRRVLLLSATPVLHNEQSFLAMLHLLDPQVYPLDSLNDFKKRIQLRQEIAERMMDLREDESNFFLGDTLEVLGDMLLDDQELQCLRHELAKLIDQDVDEQDERRIELIRSVRSHVSDMWRLHRRILRNRRTDSTAAYLPGRGGAKRISYACQDESGLAEAIEAWRMTLSVSLFSASATDKAIASELARAMDELASCEPRHALEFASARLSGNAYRSTGEFPLVNGERDALEQIVRAAKTCDHAARLQKLYQLVGADDDQVSFVIFANAVETADLIFEFLQLRLPPGRVLRHSSDRLAWTQFKSEHRGHVLVCDRAAEEGLNLQKRGAVAIHYDLPFSPNRIEQRMGRLDRFGNGMPVQSAVLVCDGSRVQKYWFELVNGALEVFDQSIASLQYVIEETMGRVMNGFLDSGADTFIEAAELLGSDEGIVAKELKRIRAQDAIDSFETDTVTQDFADKLEASDFKLGRSSEKIFSDWIVRNLRFRISGEEKRFDDVFTYEFTRKVDYGVRKPFGHDTLMPADEFERLFADSIDELTPEPPIQFITLPMTFGRVTSQRRVCRLLRIGDPFVDAFEKYTRWDDRGISYAFWRYVPTFCSSADPDVFFKFDYVVSPSTEPLETLCDRHPGASLNAVLRRSRAIMQPVFAPLLLDADQDYVKSTDERIELLKAPFNKSPSGTGQDFNLNRNRWDAVAKVYDMALWRDRCEAAREQSESLLREQSGLPKWSEKCVDKATQSANAVMQQIRSRLAIANGETKSSLEVDLQFESELLEAQIEAFRNPELRVDSVGAIFLSNQMPFVAVNEDEDED